MRDVSLVDTCQVTKRTVSGDREDGRDEPWTARDARDGLLIVASMLGALAVLFGVLAVIGYVLVYLFGFPDLPIE